MMASFTRILQPASSSHWPIGLLDGGNVVLLDPLEQSIKNVAHAAKADLCSHTVSLPQKKMVRESLQRKCKTLTVDFEDHRQHFGRRCEGTAKILGGKCLQLIKCCFHFCSFIYHLMLLAKEMLFCSLYGGRTKLWFSHLYIGSHAATRICRKHGMNWVSTVKRIHNPHWIHWWPFRQVTYLYFHF